MPAGEVSPTQVGPLRFRVASASLSDLTPIVEFVSATCPHCAGVVPASVGPNPRRWCSPQCKSRYYAAERKAAGLRRTTCVVSFPACAICQVIFAARAGGRQNRATCSAPCYRLWRNAVARRRHAERTPEQTQARLERKARRRALTKGADAEVFTYVEVFARDGWICGLCDEPVSRDLKHPDPMCASLDHVVPLALGGHHVLSNVQCAHLVCNIRKGARAVA